MGGISSNPNQHLEKELGMDFPEGEVFVGFENVPQNSISYPSRTATSAMQTASYKHSSSARSSETKSWPTRKQRYAPHHLTLLGKRHLHHPGTLSLHHQDEEEDRGHLHQKTHVLHQKEKRDLPGRLPPRLPRILYVVHKRIRRCAEWKVIEE